LGGDQPTPRTIASPHDLWHAAPAVDAQQSRGRPGLFSRWHASGNSSTIHRLWAYSSTVRAGDSSKGAAMQECVDGNGMNSGKPQRRATRPVATLSQAGGTPPEGAETT